MRQAAIDSGGDGGEGGGAVHGRSLPVVPCADAIQRDHHSDAFVAQIADGGVGQAHTVAQQQFTQRNVAALRRLLCMTMERLHQTEDKRRLAAGVLQLDSRVAAFRRCAESRRHGALADGFAHTSGGVRYEAVGATQVAGVGQMQPGSEHPAGRCRLGSQGPLRHQTGLHQSTERIGVQALIRFRSGGKRCKGFGGAKFREELFCRFIEHCNRTASGMADADYVLVIKWFRDIRLVCAPGAWTIGA